MDPQVDTGLVSLLLMFALGLLGPRLTRCLWRGLVSGARRVLPRRPPAPAPRVVGRPIEEIARDVRRLGNRYRYLPGSTTFTRFEGARRAYDLVLAEACRALEVEHLLAVLPPGADLDRERGRVERVLELAGVRLDTVP
jgi:hypothetical protein